MDNKLKFLDEEHAELMGSLRKLSVSGLSTGTAVTDLLTVLEPHFAKEEKIVMPMLALAQRLAEGDEVPIESAPQAAQEIEKEYRTMFREHAEIRVLAGRAREAALAEKNTDAVETMNWLSHHAEIEEAIVYPLALLAARLLKCSK
ncbi:MAG: hemerythrin domain-containing protein [Thermoplasmata archaeon]|nr:hemerythrin domain-containing protein [Candidatus Sysuiplasma acidicola]